LFAAALWILVGFASLARLTLAAPLLPTDYSHASWLGVWLGPVSFMAKALGAAALSVGLVAGIEKRSVVAAAVGVLMSSALMVGLSDAAVIRVGVLEGVVRIGCYVPQTSQCLSMLELPYDGAPSRYTPTGADAARYTQARTLVVSEQLDLRARWFSIPGMALFRAPLYWRSGPELKAALETQRAQVSELLSGPSSSAGQ